MTKGFGDATIRTPVSIANGSRAAESVLDDPCKRLLSASQSELASTVILTASRVEISRSG
jgi:hypothetical protein